MRFTDRYIKSLKPAAKRYEVREDNAHGLGSLTVRVTPAGAKTWNYFYKFNRKTRRLTLGSYPKMTVNEAHTAQANATGLLEQGFDPGSITVEERKVERQAPTMAGLAEKFMEVWSKPQKKSWREDERIINYDILPAWGHWKVQAITKRDIHKLLDEKKKTAPVQANRTFALLRKIFSFAVERDILSSNPCTGISAPSREVQRDRYLSLQEIEIVLAKLPEAKFAELTRLALKFQLLTAQRSGEVVGMAWADVDMEAGWWTISADKAKNKLSHRVPLSKQALDVLEKARSLSDYSQWVFPSPKKCVDDVAMTNEAVCRAITRNEGLFGIPQFTPHDLRRTAASQMTSLGILRLVVSKILNHAERDITAVYDRNSYDQEKRKALDAWGRVIAGLCEQPILYLSSTT